jgi:hypothetical protein
MIAFSSIVNLQAQTNSKLSKQILGTWLLQKIEVRVNPNAKNKMPQEALDETLKMYSKMMPPIPQNKIAFVFEKDGKLKNINSMTIPETVENGTWQLKDKTLSIKYPKGELFENVVVNIKGETMDFTIISPTGQFTADSPLTMNAVLKKGTLKDLDYSEVTLPEPPPIKYKQEITEEANKLIISATQVVCEIGNRKKCYQFKTSEYEKWQVLFDEINDFGYEEGYEYVLEVQREGIKSEIKEVN